MSFALAVIALVFVMSIFFRVSDIRVEGNTHYTDAEIIKAIDIEQGDNLFFFDRFSAISRVFAKLPYVEEVAVSRELPDRVIISVSECKALAYLQVGDEEWTMDHSCKILGKATEEELSSLLPIVGFDPGTLMIGETLTEANGDEEAVAYLAEVLYQIQQRGLVWNIRKIDFSHVKNVSLKYDTSYTLKLGGYSKVDHKFAMIVSAINQLKEGDLGTIDVSDGSTAHFIPQ